MNRLWITGVLLSAVCMSARAESVHIIESANGSFSPSFRGDANSTYFAWEPGSWNAAAAGDPREFRTTPSDNPGALSDATLVRSSSSIAAAPNIVSSSGNLYTSPAAIDMTLTIPTLGVTGSGFTTIIIQGKSLDGFGGQLDVFSFGDIDGVSAEYIRAANADGATQWWAKYELAGNSAAYDVHVGADVQLGLLSISQLVVDTFWSSTGFAPDVAYATAPNAIPEPTSIAMSLLGMLGVAVARHRMRRSA